MPDNMYSRYMVKLTQQEYVDLAYETLIDIRDNWNVLTAVDKENTPDIFIAVDKHTENSQRYQDKRYGDLEDSLQWQCLLAVGVYRLLPLFSADKQIEVFNIYQNLLKGVYRCFENDNINRHPLKTVKYDNEPISTDMISALVLLVAVTKDAKLTKLISDSFNYSDYFIPRTTIDLSPNLIWNPIRAMSYAGIRIIQGKLTESDKNKVLDMMSIMPYDKTPANERSIYGALTAVTLCEALGLLHEDFRIPAIKFITYQQESTHEMNPEWSGSLAVLHHHIGYKTLMEDNIELTLKWASQFKDLDRINNEHLSEANRQFPLPLKFRTPNDYYWQRSAYWNHPDISRDHPNVDYITILGKSLPFVFYQA